MKNNIKKVFLTTLLIIMVPAVIYFGFLFVAHSGDPHFLKIDSCLDNGGKWNYQENICEYIERIEEKWHVSPSNDPSVSTIYPVISWANVQKIKIGMGEQELKSLIRDIQNYHHPVNAIIYMNDQNNIKYEVAIK